MNLIHTGLLLLLILSIQPTSAQSNDTGLKIGDTVPDLQFTTMGPHPEQFRLSDLKGKLVILDFWSTGCTSCIKKFPKLDSLQAEYQDRLKIVLMIGKQFGDTYEKVNRIFQLYKKNYGKDLALPSVINDSIGSLYFPHRIVSHIVLIDQQGIVKDITGDITRKSIVAALEGGATDFVQKEDFLPNIRNQQFFSLDTTGIRYKSFLSGFLGGLTKDFERSLYPGYGSSIMRFHNRPLTDLLARTHGSFADNRIIVENFERNAIVYSQDSVWESWISKNGYCYELIAPEMTDQQRKEQLKRDIANTLHIEAAKETRTVDCWVLKMDKEQVKKLRQQKPSGEKLFNLNSMAGMFNHLDIPVLAETDFDDKLFKVRETHGMFGMDRLPDLQKFAADNGLTLVREKKELKVLVIRKAG